MFKSKRSRSPESKEDKNPVNSNFELNLCLSLTYNIETVGE